MCIRDRRGVAVKYSDTALMLNNYAKLSAIPNISGKVNYSDTALMLSNYARSSTIPNLSGKMNYSDTGSMLNPYLLSNTAYQIYQPKGSYLTGINSSQVTNALGFTPYDAANPNGFIAANYTGFDVRYLSLTGGTVNGNLNVNGIITTNKLTVLPGQVGTWPDYVFSKKYQLRTLSELEEYIKQFQHLPDVPSANEVEKQGVNVVDNQASLLRKIEELTLYIIELKKENAKIKKETSDRLNAIEKKMKAK